MTVLAGLRIPASPSFKAAIDGEGLASGGLSFLIPSVSNTVVQASFVDLLRSESRLDQRFLNPNWTDTATVGEGDDLLHLPYQERRGAKGQVMPICTVLRRRFPAEILPLTPTVAQASYLSEMTDGRQRTKAAPPSEFHPARHQQVAGLLASLLLLFLPLIHPLVQAEALPQMLVAGSLSVSPTSGAPGDAINIRGVAGSPGGEVRFFWDQDGVMKLLGTARSVPDGSFAAMSSVPVTATTSPARIGASATGDPFDGTFVWADFRATAPAPASILGTLQDATGLPAVQGTRVRLRNYQGLVVGEVATDARGTFTFAGLIPGGYLVEPLPDYYVPQQVFLPSGEQQNLVGKPVAGGIDIPPVYLMSAGAIAIPGGLFQGTTQPVRVGDWTDTPFARLVSLKGKGQKPITVRFWAELKRGLLAASAPLVVVMQIAQANGTVVQEKVMDAASLVHSDSPHNFQAFHWDVNSIELPPGKLQFRVMAFSSFFAKVGHWSFPVEMVGLGDRWFASWVKDQKLTVTRKNFFELQHSFQGTLPNLPGFGTPIFNEPIDLKFKKVNNRFDLGVKVSESIASSGFWSGTAKASAQLTLLDYDVLGSFGGSQFFKVAGTTLPNSTYKLDPTWVVPLPGGISIPVWGGGIPHPIDICGMKFGGSLGVFLELSGAVSLYSSIEKNLRLTATVSPSVTVALPAKASLNLAVCSASANVTPAATLAIPLSLDPAKKPPVGWDGLCITLSGSASASLDCCEVFDFKKSINLFDPIHIGNCPSAFASLESLQRTPAPSAETPPLDASVAVGPLGQAIAVWANVVWERGVPRRTAPVYSIFDGAGWGPAQLLAGNEYAGWEPKVAFIGRGRVLVTWIHLHPSQRTSRPAALARLADMEASPTGNAKPQSVCSDITGAITGTLCAGLGLVSSAVSTVGDWFGLSPESNTTAQAGTGVRWQTPLPVMQDDLYNFRPVLSGNPTSGEAQLVWLREQEVLPGQQPLALYTASYRDGAGWSAPARLDPASNAMDIQPSVRFDRNGVPGVAWLRDNDADLSTTDDRQLLFAVRGRANWSVPEEIVGASASPWTPSLDFDTQNRPTVAFVSPPLDPSSGRHVPADGQLSTLNVAQRGERGWFSTPVGDRVRAELPLLRVTGANQATLLFRSFGSGDANSALGEIAAATANLSAPTPTWAVGRLAHNRRLNWRLAADVDPETGDPLMLWEVRDGLQPEAPPVMLGERRVVAVDFAFGEEGLSFSSTFPKPGDTLQITARLVNQGLASFRDAAVDVQFFDRLPVRGTTPFATRTVRTALGFGESIQVTADYPVRDRTSREFHVVVDPQNLITENDESNNSINGHAGGVPPVGAVNVAPVASGLHLAWPEEAGGNGERYWIRRSSGRGVFELIGSTTLTEFTDTGALQDVAYTYEVTRSEEATGEHSARTISLPATNPPPDAAGLTQDLRLEVIAFQGAVHLSWNTLPAVQRGEMFSGEAAPWTSIQNDVALPAVQLETASSLSRPATAWSPVLEGVVEIGGIATFSLPAGRQAQFFRLARR